MEPWREDAGELPLARMASVKFIRWSVPIGWTQSLLGGGCSGPVGGI